MIERELRRAYLECYYGFSYWYIILDCIFNCIYFGCIFDYIISDCIFDYTICDCIFDHTIFRCGSISRNTLYAGYSLTYLVTHIKVTTYIIELKLPSRSGLQAFQTSPSYQESHHSHYSNYSHYGQWGHPSHFGQYSHQNCYSNNRYYRQHEHYSSYTVPPSRSVFPDCGPFPDFFEEIGPDSVWKVRFFVYATVVGESSFSTSKQIGQ